MGGKYKTSSKVDYLPYILCENSVSKKEVKLLIDSGSNKNLIKKGIIPSVEFCEETMIKNITGDYCIKTKGTINLLGHRLPDQTYYEMNFHNFFDGILGSEYLAMTGGVLNYKNETLTIEETSLPFFKYIPAQKLYNHIVTINTLSDGDWFVPSYQVLCKNAVIQPGLYHAKNKQTTVFIISPCSSLPLNEKVFGINVNNFETISPIPLQDNEKLDELVIEKLIATEHLSLLEKKYLLKTILDNQQVLLKENERLSSTSIIKHKIITKDNEPTYTKSYRFPNSFKTDVENQIK